MALPVDGLVRDGLKFVSSALRQDLTRNTAPVARDAADAVERDAADALGHAAVPDASAKAGSLGRDVFKSSDYPFVNPHSKSAWAHVHAVGGTQQVAALPAVSNKATKLGVYGVFDNNLSQGGKVIAQRFAKLGKLAHAGLVYQSTDPVDHMTIRELDDAGKLPYLKLGNQSGSDPAQLENFVRQNLFGSSGGAASGAKDLVLADHGGAIFGWGQTKQGAIMGWPDAMQAIRNGMPADQKLRALVLDMCMTGGSAEAAVEASAKNVADVMVGSEDESISEGFHEDKLLAALNANPNLDGKAISKEIMAASKPHSIDTRDYQVVATSLDPKKVSAFTSAFKNLADLLKSKGEGDQGMRQSIRQAFAATRAPYVETGPEAYPNRDVKLLMQNLRAHVKDPQIVAATRAVDQAHDGMVIAHQENQVERGATRGMSVSLTPQYWNDAPLGLYGKTTTYGEYYKQTAFDQATGWSGVLDLANRDDALLAQGVKVSQGGDKAGAIGLLRQAVAENPTNLTAQAWLGSLLAQDAKTAPEAQNILRGVARHQAFGSLSLATTKRDLGTALANSGDPTRAAIELGKMKDNLDAYLAAGQSSLSYSDYLNTQQQIQARFGGALALLGKLKQPAAKP